MAIASPNENVYYYECSNGQFRLSYFIPPAQLKKLSDEGRISSDALKDFPDGVDIGCIETDFKEFKKAYGYSIPRDPSSLRHAFSAIFSTTRNWKKFRGSGFIPAADLERHIKKVDGALPREKKIREDIELPPERPSLKQLRRRKRRQAVLQRQKDKVLEELQVKGIDPDRNLAEQKVSAITMKEDADAEEVFIRLHQKKRKE
jgi:hypothetical protein